MRFQPAAGHDEREGAAGALNTRNNSFSVVAFAPESFHFRDYFQANHRLISMERGRLVNGVASD